MNFKSLMAWAVISLLLLIGAPAFSADRSVAEQKGDAKRVALIIGNATYPGTAALKNPANDAKDIATQLRGLGFDVTLRTNVAQKSMLRALSEFGDKVVEGSEALFFYAGHGMQVRGKNYMIPIDADIRSESHVSSEAVDVDQLLDKLSRARLSIVILDACRNNPFERRFRGGGQGLAQINAPTGTLIAYATAPGKVAADGEGKNGLYTQELLKVIGIPGIKVEDVFKRVRANVVRQSGDAQTPWETSSLTGDFYFSAESIAGRSDVNSFGSPATIDADDALWGAVEKGNTREDYAAYLQRYPSGKYATLASSRRQRLEAISEDERQEPERWVEANNSGSEESYRSYLQKYPNGRYAEAARMKIAKIEAENHALAEKAKMSTICLYRKRSFNNSNVSANVDIDGKRQGVLAKNGDAFCVLHPPGAHVIAGYGLMPPHKTLSIETEAGKIRYVEVDSTWSGWETIEISETEWQQQVGPLRWR